MSQHTPEDILKGKAVRRATLERARAALHAVCHALMR
jgi:hypothetical protein